MYIFSYINGQNQMYETKAKWQ